jgi:hypothetical protein
MQNRNWVDIFCAVVTVLLYIIVIGAILFKFLTK